MQLTGSGSSPRASLIPFVAIGSSFPEKVEIPSRKNVYSFPACITVRARDDPVLHNMLVARTRAR